MGDGGYVVGGVEEPLDPDDPLEPVPEEPVPELVPVVLPVPELFPDAALPGFVLPPVLEGVLSVSRNW